MTIDNNQSVSSAIAPDTEAVKPVAPGNKEPQAVSKHIIIQPEAQIDGDSYLASLASSLHSPSV